MALNLVMKSIKKSFEANPLKWFVCQFKKKVWFFFCNALKKYRERIAASENVREKTLNWIMFLLDV